MEGTRCPTCGSTISYVGFLSIECRGEFALDKYTRHCPNFFGLARANEADAPQPNTARWARIVRYLTPSTQFCARPSRDHKMCITEADPAAGWPSWLETGYWEVV